MVPVEMATSRRALRASLIVATSVATAACSFILDVDPPPDPPPAAPDDAAAPGDGAPGEGGSGVDAGDPADGAPE